MCSPMCIAASRKHPFSEAEIRRALANGEFFYVHQPKLEIAGGHICGAESLLRWNRQDEVICPDDFIPAAEKDGFISDITRTMFPVLLDDLRVIGKTFPHLTSSFNMSATDLVEGEMTMPVIKAIVDGDLMPGHFRIEITETAQTSDIEKLKTQFQVLLDAGAKLAMDDLGKGYSSLDLLAKLPFTCLKIDKEMVGSLDKKPSKTHHIVSSICTMARKLGMTLIAEGVENHRTLIGLKRLGCNQAQGYWISQPLHLHDYLDFVRHRQMLHAAVQTEAA